MAADGDRPDAAAVAMTAADSVTAAQRTVLDVIGSLLPTLYGPGARLLSRPRMQRRSWSIHFLPTVETSDGEVDLIVKIPLWERAPDLPSALAAGPQKATGAEYEMLGRIEEMVSTSGVPGLAAVHRVAYAEAINAVVMERLNSRTMREVRGPRRTAAGSLTGAWLRRFHDGIGSATEGVLEPLDFGAELGDLEERAAGLSSALLASIASVEQAADRLVGHPVRRATTHGDLGPSNILVTPGGEVAVIDPNLVEAPVETDLAKLAVAVRTPRARLLTGTPMRTEMHEVEKALLDGYGDASPEIYRLSRRVAAARRWVEIEEAAVGMKRLSLPMARRVLAAESR